MASKTVKSNVTDLPIYSRFAVLEKDSSDEEKPTSGEKDDESKRLSKSAKKRAKKKKKTASEAAEAEQLRNMAFRAKPMVKKSQGVASSPVMVLHPDEKPFDLLAEEEENPDSWETWRQRDEKYVVDQFQQDLERALHNSIEDAKNHQRRIEELIRIEQTGKGSPRKEQALKMSLDEFQVLPLQPESHHQPHNGLYDTIWPEAKEDLEDTPNDMQTRPYMSPEEEHCITNKKEKKKKKKKRTGSETNGNEDLEDCLRCTPPEVNAEEQIEASHHLDPASIAQWKYEVEKRDHVINKLKEDTEVLKTELSQVKKRNKQLCFILGQGEMKDKSDLLQQIEELIVVKDELSSELSEMHSALEQERSKVSSLKQELAKQQGLRAKRHSTSES